MPPNVHPPPGTFPYCSRDTIFSSLPGKGAQKNRAVHSLSSLPVPASRGLHHTSRPSASSGASSLLHSTSAALNMAPFVPTISRRMPYPR